MKAGRVSRRRNLDLGKKEKKKEKEMTGRCKGPNRQTERKQESRTYRIKER